MGAVVGEVVGLGVGMVVGDVVGDVVGAVVGYGPREVVVKGFVRLSEIKLVRLMMMLAELVPAHVTSWCRCVTA